MKTAKLNKIGLLLFPLVLAALAPGSARADAEDVIKKSFNVQSGGKLVVQLDRGSIEIRTADTTTAKIEISRKAGGAQAAAEKLLQEHLVATTLSDNTVKVTSEFTGSKSTGWFGRSPDLRVNCIVTIPKRFDVDLTTSGGNVSVTELQGKAEARTSGGSMKFEKIGGPLSARTSGGSIKAEQIQGAVELRTSGGNLNLMHIEGDLIGRTSGGSIQAEQLAGKVELKTSGGSIKISECKGPVDASTSGGSISAELLVQPSGACSFKTSGGSVKISLPETVAIDVDAKTSGGHVSSAFAVATQDDAEKQAHDLQGKINGGGPLLTARTSGGSIYLEKN